MEMKPEYGKMIVKEVLTLLAVNKSIQTSLLANHGRTIEDILPCCDSVLNELCNRIRERFPDSPLHQESEYRALGRIEKTEIMWEIKSADKNRTFKSMAQLVSEHLNKDTDIICKEVWKFQDDNGIDQSPYRSIVGTKSRLKKAKLTQRIEKAKSK